MRSARSDIISIKRNSREGDRPETITTQHTTSQALSLTLDPVKFTITITREYESVVFKYLTLQEAGSALLAIEEQIGDLKCYYEKWDIGGYVRTSESLFRVSSPVAINVTNVTVTPVNSLGAGVLQLK